MILMLTSAQSAERCAPALERTCGERVQFVADLRSAVALLKRGEYSAIVIDQALLAPDSGAFDLVTKNAGMAVPVLINPAISGVERVAQEVKGALLRRDRGRQMAVREAEATLRSDLTGAVAGILLSSELALQHPALPLEVAQKLQSVRELAIRMQHQLEGKST